MKLNISQLDQHTRKPLLPIYLIAGDEPLLLEETVATLRQATYQTGCTERESWHVDAQFDWDQFTHSAQNLSLFGEKTLLELRIASGKLNEKNKNGILAYLERLPAEKILILIMGKLDKSTQQTKWFKNLDQVGVFIPIWPITIEQLPHWITQRLKLHSLTADPIAIRHIAEKTEGNLLAAQQIIEKLSLLYQKKHLSIEEIEESMHDLARYDIFILLDEALAGHTQRTLKMLASLQTENIEPTLILWSIAKEVRGLITMAEKMQQGEPLEQVMRAQFVWDKRKPLISAALKRHQTHSLYRLLQQIAQIDHMIKGAKYGNIWNQLNSIYAQLSTACNTTLSAF